MECESEQSPEGAQYISEGYNPSNGERERSAWIEDKKMKSNFQLYSRMGGMMFMAYIATTLTGCHRPFDNTTNVLKIDTLENTVKEIDNTLILDEDVFKARDDSMNLKLNLIHTKMKVITDGDTAEAVLRYAGIEKNYADFLKNYPVMEYDESGYQASVKAMKQKVVDQKISQSEFDSFYKTTKPRIDNLLNRSKTMTYNTVSIEKDYTRTDPKVTELYDKLMSKK